MGTDSRQWNEGIICHTRFYYGEDGMVTYSHITFETKSVFLIILVSKVYRSRLSRPICGGI